MVNAQILSLVAIAVTAVSASADIEVFAALLKRQEPGSPAYYCHDNCGQAIIAGRNSADPCTDSVFQTDYKACLQCSGPDNYDIWKMYGRTLSTTGQKCGLSTTPLSGKQADVGPALPAGGPGGQTTGAPPTSKSSTPPATTAQTTASTAVTTPSESGHSGHTTSPPSPAPTGGAGNGTTTRGGPTATPVQTAGAVGMPIVSTFGVLGAALLGALFVAGN